MGVPKSIHGGKQRSLLALKRGQERFCVVMVYLSRFDVASQQGHQDRGVRCPPDGGQVPTWAGAIAAKQVRRQWADSSGVPGDLVERRLVPWAFGDLVDGRVHETEAASGVLVGDGHDAGPHQGTGAGPITSLLPERTSITSPRSESARAA